MRPGFALKYLKRFIFTYLALRKASGTKIGAKVNRYTRLSRKTYIGDSFNSNGLLVYGRGKITIGKNFHCGERCKILTENHDYETDGDLPYDSGVVIKDVEIGENVWFGMDVTILPGVSIGEGVIIQAGSVVTRDLPPLAIAGGHPAAVFSYRDANNYWTRKSAANTHSKQRQDTIERIVNRRKL